MKLIALLFSTLISATSFAQSTQAGQDASWKIVPTQNVCMVTEAHFNRPQIPVKVDGKTYYGCCDNCKQTLTENKKARTATDPLTKKPVDKATAVIAANNAGSVLYFENKKNFEKYMKGSGSHSSSRAQESHHGGH